MLRFLTVICAACFGFASGSGGATNSCKLMGKNNGNWGPCERYSPVSEIDASDSEYCYETKLKWSKENVAWRCGFRYYLAYRPCNCSESVPSGGYRPPYSDWLYHYNYLVRRGYTPEETCACEQSKPKSSRLYRGEENCGRRNEEAQFRVMGGHPVRPNSWKWVAALVDIVNPSIVHCSGTLVAPQWVLTAAHCLHDGSGRPRMLKVVLADHNRLLNESIEITRSVDWTFMPPGYEIFSSHRDIALLKLDRPVEKGPHVDYACLPSNTATLPSGTNCYITGWGRVEKDNYATPDELQEAEVPLVNWHACRNVPAYSFITRKQLCAGLLGENPRDACAGDSGGGLFCKMSVEYEVNQWSYFRKSVRSSHLARNFFRSAASGSQRPANRSAGNSSILKSTTRTSRPTRAVTTRNLVTTRSSRPFSLITTRKANGVTVLSRSYNNTTGATRRTRVMTRSSQPQRSSNVTVTVKSVGSTAEAASKRSTATSTRRTSPTSTTTRTSTRTTRSTTKPSTSTHSTSTSATTAHKEDQSIIVREDRWFTYGVTSFGTGCGVNWGVYQRVAAFSDWIRETITTYS